MGFDHAMAELGFIVVKIDGMGTRNRGKAFHDVCYQNLSDAGFPDRILWMKALHARYSYADTERVGMKTPRRERPPIQQCLRRGQEILVQVLKEGLGSKGPTLTSYLSIPGRFLVMMPNMERHGVSRKIDDPEKRRQIHKILEELNPPEDFGFKEESLNGSGVGRAAREDHLQGAEAVQSAMSRLVDDAHPAPADLLNHIEPGNLGQAG